jgi:phage protein D
VPETALSANPVYAARPTVRVDGQENEKLTASVIGMEVVEGEGGMSSLELTVRNVAGEGETESGLAWEDGAVLDFGKTVALYGGDEREPREIFRGVITGLEGVFTADGAPELVVLAEDALQRARMARRTAVHDNATIASLAQEIASRLSLTPRITGLSDDLGTQVQMNESDLAFLRRLLADRDGDLQVVGDELHVSPRADVRRGTVDLSLHGQLISCRALADLSQQVTKVTAAGWDPVAGERVSVTSTGAHAGPGRGRKGADALSRALSERSEHVREIAVLNEGEAQALADTVFDRRARRFVVIDATAQGNPSIRVGTHVTLHGLGPRFDNTYYVVRATHRFDTKDGYLTHFEAECGFLGEG